MLDARELHVPVPSECALLQGPELEEGLETASPRHHGSVTAPGVTDSPGPTPSPRAGRGETAGSTNVSAPHFQLGEQPLRDSIRLHLEKNH